MGQHTGVKVEKEVEAKRYWALPLEAGTIHKDLLSPSWED